MSRIMRSMEMNRNGIRKRLGWVYLWKWEEKSWCIGFHLNRIENFVVEKWNYMIKMFELWTWNCFKIIVQVFFYVFHYNFCSGNMTKCIFHKNQFKKIIANLDISCKIWNDVLISIQTLLKYKFQLESKL